MVAHHYFRGSVQHSGATVITETAPCSQHAGLACPRELLNSRKAAQEFVIVLDYRRNSGLLQHNLRDPNAVGIVIDAPRQIALVQVVPGEQPAVKPLRRGEHGLRSGWSVQGDSVNRVPQPLARY